MEKPKVLVVEDEKIIALDLSQNLSNHGYAVLPIASDADTAVRFTKEYSPNLVLMDIVLKGEKTGIDAAREIRSSNQVPIVFLTGNSHLLAETGNNFTADITILTKPSSDRQLYNAIETALR